MQKFPFPRKSSLRKSFRGYPAQNGFTVCHFFILPILFLFAMVVIMLAFFNHFRKPFNRVETRLFPSVATHSYACFSVCFSFSPKIFAMQIFSGIPCPKWFHGLLFFTLPILFLFAMVVIMLAFFNHFRKPFNHFGIVVRKE